MRSVEDAQVRIERLEYLIELARSGGGGGSSPLAFSQRADLSVNSARIEGIYSPNPVLHTQTGGNTAGGFNGGGLGNKAIAGFDVGNGLPLGLLTDLEWTWLNLISYNPGFPVYANLVLDVNGDGSLYKILVIDPTVNPLLNTYSNTVGPNGTTTKWNAGTNFIQVVNFIAGVTPAVNLGPFWPSQSFQMSGGPPGASILSTYPNAVLRRANSGDGGLPNGQVTPAFMLITGDSGNNTIRSFALSGVKFNGAAI